MSYNFEVESGSTVKFPVGGKYCDRDIVVSATGSNGGTDEFFEQYMARSFTEFESDTVEPIPQAMFVECIQLKSVSCPNVEVIGAKAFMDCFALEVVDFPKLKKLLANDGFRRCTALTNFPYFAQLEETGGYTFDGCPIEQKVWDFENLTKVSAQYGFYGCSAEVIIFRKPVNRIDRIWNGAKKLRVVDLHKAFTIGRYAFQSSNNMEALILRDTEAVFELANVDILTTNTNYYAYVPAVLMDSYKSATNWSAHPDRLRPLDLERLAWYAPDRVLWLDSECNTLTGHADGVISLADLSKNGHDATIIGILTYDDGYIFNGNAVNYITVPATSALDDASELTYEMVWDLSDVSETQRLLFSGGLQIYTNGGLFKCDLNFDGSPKEQPSTAATTGFVSFAVVFKANEHQKFFVNGVEIQSFTAGTNSANAPTFYVGQGNGQYPTKSGNKFLAMRAYDRALTSEEINANYALDAERWA